jgi:cellulose synthase/poly-beta-1,6-N-acetylglucosamine synthase-like glycosyltransferase
VTQAVDASNQPRSADGCPFEDLTDPGTVLLHATPESQQEGLDRLRMLAEQDPRPYRRGTADDYGPRHRARAQPPDTRQPDYRHSRVGHHRVGRGSASANSHIPAGYDQGSQAFKILTIAAVIVVLATTAVTATAITTNTTLVFYWVFNAAVISICLIAYLNERRFGQFPVARGYTIAIIPAYNEPADKLEACVRSLIAQTVPIDRIVVVDDGSAYPVEPFYHERVIWIRQPNRGKRGAHVTALQQFDPEHVQFVLTVDSDSTPYPDALEHMLRAMSRRKVQAVTGWLHVRNYDDSLIARAADINIGSSCVMMRASRSMLGALETTSGALSLYRAEILYDNIAEYEVDCGTGDDRWLTMRALLRGEVIGVNQARVKTDMPATLRGTFRQRLRWSRSWWWMLPFAYARLGWRPLVSPTVGLIQLLAAPVILVWAIVSFALDSHVQFSHPRTALIFAVAYITVKFAVSALYLVGRQDMPRGQKIKSLLLGTPIALVMSMLLLMPLRFYALTRLQDSRWHTRQVKPV